MRAYTEHRMPAMLYLEHSPVAPLNTCVRTLWYARAPEVAHPRERILPNGCVQIILNLARDFVLECPEEGGTRRLAPSLVVGARVAYEIVDTSDMADLIGMLFEPGGFAGFARDAVDRFSHQNVSLEDVWGASSRGLRDRLRETPSPHGKLRVLENHLLATFAARLGRNPLVDFALHRFFEENRAASVREVAKETGWSERRFTQIFREEVGLTPKVWCRLSRFQRAVRQLHGGGDVRWAELALDCGYYDQSHFANEFRAFSGIDVTSYSARRTAWANHVCAD